MIKKGVHKKELNVRESESEKARNLIGSSPKNWRLIERKDPISRERDRKTI